MIIENYSHLEQCPFAKTCEQLGKEDGYCQLVMSLNSALEMPDIQHRQKHLKDLATGDSYGKNCPLFSAVVSADCFEEDLASQILEQRISSIFVRNIPQMI